MGWWHGELLTFSMMPFMLSPTTGGARHTVTRVMPAGTALHMHRQALRATKYSNPSSSMYMADDYIRGLSAWNACVQLSKGAMPRPCPPSHAR